MQRTNTTQTTLFHLPAPNGLNGSGKVYATYDFRTPNRIRINIPHDSAFAVAHHWHADGAENCKLLHTEQGQFQVSYHKEPRTGGTVLGVGDFVFKPGFWTYWTRRKDNQHRRPPKPNPSPTPPMVPRPPPPTTISTLPEKPPGHNDLDGDNHALAEEDEKENDTILTLIVHSDSLDRNICSAILDARIYPSLSTTPIWLRWLFAVLAWISPPLHRRLLSLMLYLQMQTMYTHHGYFQYHGGVNALRWWQWTHPFDIGQHPAWTVRLQYRSQKIFSQVVQGWYHALGTRVLGMKGDYEEYNNP